MMNSTGDERTISTPGPSPGRQAVDFVSMELLNPSPSVVQRKRTLTPKRHRFAEAEDRLSTYDDPMVSSRLRHQAQWVHRPDIRPSHFLRPLEELAITNPLQVVISGLCPSIMPGFSASQMKLVEPMLQETTRGFLKLWHKLQDTMTWEARELKSNPIQACMESIVKNSNLQMAAPDLQQILEQLALSRDLLSAKFMGTRQMNNDQKRASIQDSMVELTQREYTKFESVVAILMDENYIFSCFRKLVDDRVGEQIQENCIKKWQKQRDIEMREASKPDTAIDLQEAEKAIDSSMADPASIQRELIQVAKATAEKVHTATLLEKLKPAITGWLSKGSIPKENSFKHNSRAKSTPPRILKKTKGKPNLREGILKTASKEVDRGRTKEKGQKDPKTPTRGGSKHTRGKSKGENPRDNPKQNFTPKRDSTHGEDKPKGRNNNYKNKNKNKNKKENNTTRGRKQQGTRFDPNPQQLNF